VYNIFASIKNALVQTFWQMRANVWKNPRIVDNEKCMKPNQIRGNKHDARKWTHQAVPHVEVTNVVMWDSTRGQPSIVKLPNIELKHEYRYNSVLSTVRGILIVHMYDKVCIQNIKVRFIFDDFKHTHRTSHNDAANVYHQTPRSTSWYFRFIFR
jgi:hypothetical protein